MSVQMVKINGKMVPAKKNKKGVWEPIENASLVLNKNGELEVEKSKKEKEE